MLAWLQRFTTIGLLALALAWAGWQLRQGRPGWALAGALLIVLGYALVLAAEFVFMHAVNVRDTAPRATLGQVAQAWRSEVLSAPAVFWWHQPFRCWRWPDHLPAHAGGRRGLLLVHGYICNRGVWNPWLERLTALDVPFVAVNLEPVFGSIDDYVQVIEDGMRRLEAATGMPPVVVAHSMGGLALRCWWQEAGGDSRVHHAITLGSPHQGTRLARLAFSRNGRQVQVGSPWLRDLAAREGEGFGARFTCYFGHCDNIVFPASSALLPAAHCVHLSAVAHVHMADRPEPLAEALRRLGVTPP
jgi:triacylglycerol lipase